MDPWEYKVQVFGTYRTTDVRNALNRIGADGWELVSTSFATNSMNLVGDLVLIFKRPGLGQFDARPEDAPGYVVS